MPTVGPPILPDRSPGARRPARVGVCADADTTRDAHEIWSNDIGAPHGEEALAKTAAAASRAKKRNLDALPDTVDFRDRMYVPTLVEVRPEMPLARWRTLKVPILDQGAEGACTGFGLATVANYLLRQIGKPADASPVSPRMIYEMAKRYDEWPGENYDGSSARGAMKGWHKHGICAERTWPYDPKRSDRELSQPRAVDALRRPLGAYFRVNHGDLVAMHSAITEAGALFATSSVHEGWDKVDTRTGIIPFKGELLGGHAFAIIGYDTEGFWIQNSWGKGWGRAGFARIAYDDWLKNGLDVWVARLGVPIELHQENATAAMRAAAPQAYEGQTFCALRPHIVSIGNDGRLRDTGTFGTNAGQIKTMIGRELAKSTAGWPTRRVLLYAHGGLVDEASAIQRVADYRQTLLEAKIFPVSFIWKSDYWTTLRNILSDALGRRRPEGILDTAKDFMLDRLDDTIEPIARAFSGKAAWDEMKENALGATTDPEGGARLVLRELVKLGKLEIHVVAHSAGAIFMAPLLQLLTAKGKIADGPMKGAQGLGQSVASCTLWAPACTVELFEQAYVPGIKSGAIGNAALFTLNDRAEQDDDCAGIYHKSLLYLVSRAFEARARIAGAKGRDQGVPVLGLARSIEGSATLSALRKSGKLAWITAPNESADPLQASRATHHGDFDDDKATLQASFGRILVAGGKTGAAATGDGKMLELRDLQQQTRARRQHLDQMARR